MNILIKIKNEQDILTKATLIKEFKALDVISKAELIKEFKEQDDKPQEIIIPKTENNKRAVLTAKGNFPKIDLDNIPSNNVVKGKKARLEANQKAFELIKEKGINGDYTDEEKEILSKFSGYGSLDTEENDEYYTPKKVAHICWGLLKINKNSNFLDPCCGNGIFSSVSPSNINIQGVELNKTSGAIAQILNKNTKVQLSAFEEFAISNNDKVDGIITNVPFGLREELHKSIDKEYEHVKRLEDYFILRSLDKLKEGQRAIFLTTSSTAQRKNKSRRDVRYEILKKASFITGYRLPSQAFKTTGTEQVVDILMFEKHPNEIIDTIYNNNFNVGELAEAIQSSNTNKDFLEGEFFDNNRGNILGVFTSQEQKKEQSENGGDVHFREVRDRVELKEGIDLDTSYKILANNVTRDRNTLKNGFGYDEITLNINSLTQVQLLENEEIKQKAMKEADNIRSEKGMMKSDDFIKFYEDNIVELRNTFSMHSTCIQLEMRYLSLKNKVKEDDRSLLRIFHFTEEAKIDFEASKNINETLLYFSDKNKRKKLYKDFVILRGLNYHRKLDRLFNSINKDGEIEKDFSLTDFKEVTDDKNSISVSDGGYNIYNTDDFTKEEIMSDEVMLIKDDENMYQVIKTTDFAGNFSGKLLNDAVYEIEGISLDNINTDKLSADELEQKKKQMIDNLNNYSKSLDIENLDITAQSIGLFLKKELVSKIIYSTISKHENVLYKAFVDSCRTYFMENKGRDRLKYMDNVPDALEGTLVTRNIIDAFIKKEANISKSFSAVKLRSSVFQEYSNQYNDTIIKNNYKNLIRNILTGIEDVINFSISNTVKEDSLFFNKYKEAIQEQTVIFGGAVIADDDTPLNELSGMATGKLIEQARKYQIEDARHFAKTLKGTIAQDTGLGKTKTMLLTALKSLESGRAKRVLISTPNGVLTKLHKSFIEDVTDKYKGRIALVTSKTFDADIEHIKNSDYDKNKRVAIVVVPHSVLGNTIAINDKHIGQIIYEPEKIVNGTKIRNTTPFFQIIGRKFPDFSKSKIYIENLKIDMLLIDEQQDFKNVANLKSYKYANSVSSNESVRVAFLSEYIRKIARKDNRGVVCVTATPYTNSASEILSNAILSGVLANFENSNTNWFNKFTKNFYDVSNMTHQKTTGMGEVTVETFTGIRNKGLLDTILGDNIRYRSAEIEQKRVKGLTVKPPYTNLDNHIEETEDIRQTYDKFALLNDGLSQPNEDQMMLMSDVTKEGEVTQEDRYLMRLQSSIGSIFSFIGRVTNLSISHKFSYGVTPIVIKKGTTTQDLINALMELKSQSLMKKNDDDIMTLLAFLDDGFTNFVKTFVLDNSNYTIPPTYKDTKKEEIETSIRSIVLPTVEEEGDKTIFNCYSLDNKIITKVIKALIKKGIIEDGICPFSIEHFPKYKDLVVNLRDSFEKYPNGKQIIYSDKPVSTQTIIGYILDEQIRKKVLPEKTRIHYFNDSAINKNTDTFKLQEDFNNSTTPDIMIFGLKGKTGVDFNKNVRTVHLMNIALTPDAHHQATGRAVRQGNDVDNVDVITYFTQGTFDKFSKDLTEEKRSWIDSFKNNENKDTVKSDFKDLQTMIEEAIRMFGDEANGDTGKAVTLYKDYLDERKKAKEKLFMELKVTSRLKQAINYVSLYKQSLTTKMSEYLKKSVFPQADRFTVSNNIEQLINLNKITNLDLISFVRKYGVKEAEIEALDSMTKIDVDSFIKKIYKERDSQIDNVIEAIVEEFTSSKKSIEKTSSIYELRGIMRIVYGDYNAPYSELTQAKLKSDLVKRINTTIAQNNETIREKIVTFSEVGNNLKRSIVDLKTFLDKDINETSRRQIETFLEGNENVINDEVKQDNIGQSIISTTNIRNIKSSSTALILNHDEDRVLMGLRKDSNKWSFIGGGKEDNETPYQTIIREVKEEIGIDISDKQINLLGTELTQNNNNVSVFSVYPVSEDTKFDVTLDPDKEFEKVSWFEIDNLLTSNDIELHIDKSINIAFTYLKNF